MPKSPATVCGRCRKTAAGINLANPILRTLQEATEGDKISGRKEWLAIPETIAITRRERVKLMIPETTGKASLKNMKNATGR